MYFLFFTVWLLGVQRLVYLLKEILDLTDKIFSQIQKLINYLRTSNIKESRFL